jgi:hypothetical protein
MLEGQQYLFALPDVWNSEVPPTPGLVVDVELDGVGKIQGITVVPKSQLAREHAEEALAMAREKGGALPSSLVSTLVMRDAIAAFVLAAAWWFLTAVSIQIPFLGKLEFTFWQVLGFANGGNVLEWLDRSVGHSAGLYGVLALVALAGPFLQHLWRDRRATLGGLLPLVFMVLVGIVSRSSIQQAIAGGIPGEGTYAAGSQQARDESVRAVSLGLGLYVAVLASLYFAFASAKRFRVARSRESRELQPAARKAA